MTLSDLPARPDTDYVDSLPRKDFAGMRADALDVKGRVAKGERRILVVNPDALLELLAERDEALAKLERVREWITAKPPYPAADDDVTRARNIGYRDAQAVLRMRLSDPSAPTDTEEADE